MVKADIKDRYAVVLSIVLCGTIWGIIEATAGYLLHLMSFGYGWLIWYPAACFFMTYIYQKTGRRSSILFVGLLCAAIKMLNLLLPGSVDRVVNPAVSIIFEALAMTAVLYMARRYSGDKRKSPVTKVLMALSMNTGWRLLYILYLLLLVPDWIRDVSVIGSATKFISFFIIQNLITTALLFIGYQFISYIFGPVERFECRLKNLLDKVPSRVALILQTGMAALLLTASIFLQILLN